MCAAMSFFIFLTANNSNHIKFVAVTVAVTIAITIANADVVVVASFSSSSSVFFFVIVVLVVFWMMKRERARLLALNEMMLNRIVTVMTY